MTNKIIYLEGDKSIKSQLYLRRHALAMCKRELTNINTHINPVMLRNWIEEHERQINILLQMQYENESLSPSMASIVIIASILFALFADSIFK
jgi:hypothetical protein